MPQALRTLHDPVPLHAEGSTCTTDDLVKVGLGVAVTRGTLAAVGADWVGPPAPPTRRGSLTAPRRGADLPEVARGLNAALAAAVPPRVRWPAQAVALD